MLPGVLYCAHVVCVPKGRELYPWKGGGKISGEGPCGWVIVTRLEREISDVTKTCGASLDPQLLQKLRQEDCRLKDCLGFRVSSSKVSLENESRPWQKLKKKFR